MIPPSIDRAAGALRACAGDLAVVLVLDLESGQIGWSSYGKTRVLCAVGRKLGEHLEAAVNEFAELVAAQAKPGEGRSAGTDASTIEEPHAI